MTQAAPGYRIVIAEDDILLREGLSSLLDRSGFQVVGRAGEAGPLLDLVREQRPELVIVDIRMPPGHSTEGLEAAQVIRREFPDIAILILSAYIEAEHAIQLLASGGRVGYLLKSRVTAVDDFLDSLERIRNGAAVVDPALVQELLSARSRRDPLDTLTSREREVLRLMAEGNSNLGIARRLWITEGTVEKHVNNILGKLELSDTPDDHRRVRAVIAFLEAR